MSNTEPRSLPHDHQPSPNEWVRNQIDAILSAGDTAVADIDGRSIVVVAIRGARSGKTRLVPVMRVEHDGSYAIVASKGGAPENPQWYASVVANPQVQLQDGTQVGDYTARLAQGSERRDWWARSVEAFPPYADYQVKTEREIPVFILEPSAAG